MKRNFLKNSLAALAFSFAIIASFAFSNADSEDDFTQYIQKTGPQVCEQITPFCNNLGEIDCTVTVQSIQYDVWDDIDDVDNTLCVTPLKHDPNQ